MNGIVEHFGLVVALGKKHLLSHIEENEDYLSCQLLGVGEMFHMVYKFSKKDVVENYYIERGVLGFTWDIHYSVLSDFLNNTPKNLWDTKMFTLYAGEWLLPLDYVVELDTSFFLQRNKELKEYLQKEKIYGTIISDRLKGSYNKLKIGKKDIEGLTSIDVDLTNLDDVQLGVSVQDVRVYERPNVHGKLEYFLHDFALLTDILTKLVAMKKVVDVTFYTSDMHCSYDWRNIGYLATLLHKRGCKVWGALTYDTYLQYYASELTLGIAKGLRECGTFDRNTDIRMILDILRAVFGITMSEQIILDVLRKDSI